MSTSPAHAERVAVARQMFVEGYTHQDVRWMLKKRYGASLRSDTLCALSKAVRAERQVDE